MSFMALPFTMQIQTVKGKKRKARLWNNTKQKAVFIILVTKRVQSIADESNKDRGLRERERLTSILLAHSTSL